MCDFNPIMPWVRPGKPGDAARKQAVAQEMAVNSAMADVDKAFSGYTPEFYQERADAYTRAAMPQVGEQYNEARNQLGFDLARRGLYTSGAGQRLGEKLQNTLASQQMTVSEQAAERARELQREVENYRNQVVGQVQQSVDPSATAASALQSASQFRAPDPTPAITNAFGNFARDYLMANVATMQPTAWYGQQTPINDKGGYGKSDDNLLTVYPSH